MPRAARSSGRYSTRLSPSSRTEPRLGGDQAGDDVEHGGLARSVGPDQPDDGTGLGGQVGAVDRPHPAEGHLHALDVQAGRAPRPPATASGTAAVLVIPPPR